VIKINDGRIIELFYERKEEAILELSKKYGAACQKIALNILGNYSDAEECVNEAYLGAWNSIPPERPSPLFAYICRIVRNLAIKKYHKNTAKKRNSYYNVALDELENCIPSDFSVEDEMDSEELTRIFDDFLQNLDWENRIMFVRRYWFSDSVKDIAKMFKMSSHAVTVRLSRTREKLKKYLIDKGVKI